MNHMENDVNSELRKALDTLNTGSHGGPKLINEAILADLQRMVEDASPLYKYISKRSWETNAYTYRKLVGLPAAFSLADGANLPAADNSTYDKVTVAMKYIYSRVEITGPLAESVTWTNIVQDELSNAADGIGRKIETLLVSGDSSTTATDFDGLNKQITTNELIPGVAGTPELLTLNIMNEGLDLAPRTPDTIVGSKACYRRLWSLMQAQLRYVGSTEVDPGFSIPTYDSKPVFALDHGFDTPLADRVLFFSRPHATIAVQKPLFMAPLAKVKDSEDYLLGTYLTFAVEGENFWHGKISNLKFA